MKKKLTNENPDRSSIEIPLEDVPIVLNEKEWDNFINSLLHPPKPNKALVDAFLEYKKRNYRSDI